MARTIIIGDIHGCVDELTDLLSVDKGISLTKEDTLILIGDLLDKGPDSNGVVRLLSSFHSDGFNIVLILGNHEEKHARFRKAFAKSGKAQGDMRTITEALSDQDIAFLDSAVPYHRIPEHNALVVHGGILPGLESIPTYEDLATMSKGQVQKFYRVLRTRYVRGKTTTKITVEFNLDFVPVWETGAEINAEDIGRAPGTIIKRKVSEKAPR